jgi:lipopolysaccharide assembly outer membrane protein LptD (OstA)
MPAMRKGNALLSMLLLGTFSSAFAIDSDEFSQKIPDEPFDIQAARFEYTNDTLIASGGVTGRFENVMVRADKITGSAETGELRIEGNILFERENVVWQGSELDYNYITQTGDFGPSSLDFDPVLMSVGHVERVSTNEFRLRDAEFTTCPEENRHFHVKAREAYLVDEKYLTAKGVTVYLGKVPVFHLPYWRQTLSKSIFTFRLGYDSNWGGYALTKATIPLAKNVESITDVNLYSRRGVGVGQGLEWDRSGSEGRLSGFYLYDQDPYARFDSDYARQVIDRERYRLNFEELHRFSDTHYLDTKWNYLSDPMVLEEFFKREYRKSPQPENYGSWVYGAGYAGSEAFVNHRLNDAYDNVNRFDYSADLYRSRIGNTPFYFQSDTTFSHLERVYAETNLVDQAYDSVRLDSDNVLTLPQRLGFLNLVPRTSYRSTYYSKSAGVAGGEEVRGIFGAGMEASFQATKVLSERERWYGQGLRHKLEPYADYIYEDSTVSTNTLFQFDDVDMLGDENRVKLGLRNVLQTRRDGRLSRFLDLDLFTYYRVDRSDGEDRFYPLFLDARIPLTARTMIDMEGVYDWNEEEVPFFNTRASYRAEQILFSVEHLFQQSERSLWTPRLDLFPEGDISFETYARYDDNRNDLEEIAVAGYKNWCCLRYGLGYRYYDNGEHQVSFSIGLSAFPEESISSGM